LYCSHIPGSCGIRRHPRSRCLQLSEACQRSRNDCTVDGRRQFRRSLSVCIQLAMGGQGGKESGVIMPWDAPPPMTKILNLSLDSCPSVLAHRRQSTVERRRMLETHRTGNITTEAKKSLRGAFQHQRPVVHGNLFASNAHQWRHRAYRGVKSYDMACLVARKPLLRRHLVQRISALQQSDLLIAKTRSPHL
jgi:hypothetical protein